MQKMLVRHVLNSFMTKMIIGSLQEKFILLMDSNNTRYLFQYLTFNFFVSLFIFSLVG